MSPIGCVCQLSLEATLKATVYNLRAFHSNEAPGLGMMHSLGEGAMVHTLDDKGVHAG